MPFPPAIPHWLCCQHDTHHLIQHAMVILHFRANSSGYLQECTGRASQSSQPETRHEATSATLGMFAARESSPWGSFRCMHQRTTINAQVVSVSIQPHGRALTLLSKPTLSPNASIPASFSCSNASKSTGGRAPCATKGEASDLACGDADHPTQGPYLARGSLPEREPHLRIALTSDYCTRMSPKHGQSDARFINNKMRKLYSCKQLHRVMRTGAILAVPRRRGGHHG